MKRKCIHIISSKDGSRSIYIDADNYDQIVNYLYQDERHKKKFKFITDIILGGHKNTEVYDKEIINESCKDVTAMKFFKGQENDRIYCKEVHKSSGSYIIIAAILHERKKSQKLTHMERALIEKVGGYEYEIE